MIKIYSLTRIGQALAKSVRFTDSNDWKVIHHLAKVGHATPDQLSTYCGLGQGEVSGSLGRLRIKKIVQEETGVEV